MRLNGETGMQSGPAFVLVSFNSVRLSKCPGTITPISKIHSTCSKATSASLCDPKEDVQLSPGETYSVAPGRGHLVINAGQDSVTFLILQGIGEYDYVPLTNRN